jgi:serine/threonine protein kinase
VTDDILHSLEADQAKKRINGKNTHISNSSRASISSSSTSTAPYSFNQLTVYEKLQYAIQMSQALVELHGYVGGVIVHDDVHPDQWLISHDQTRVVLNDMNNAIILQWSRKYHQYCTFWDHYGGDYRAPEEYQEGGTYTTDEQVDVYPMGNLIYSLITGLYPYHNVTDGNETIIQQWTMNPNIRPYLHPLLRSLDRRMDATKIDTETQLEMYIYQQLIDIMDQCHQMVPHDRPSIFTVYQYLTATQNVVNTYRRSTVAKIKNTPTF